MDEKVQSGNSIPEENSVQEEEATDSFSVNNTTLKKAEVLNLYNGYSIKVLNINRKEEHSTISLRKDSQEYSRKTISVNQTYNIKDPNDQNVVYSVHLDRIYDNSFAIELTYVLNPEILLEVTLPEDAADTNVVVKLEKDSITRTYRWEYDNTEFRLQCNYYKDTYDYYSKRTRDRDWTHFVNDPYDDEFISQITGQLENLTYEGGYGYNEIPYIAMLFVQSLPYVSDSISAGYDEYPRFPFETMYNGGGDCEDSSILLAAILHDMGYGVSLIELPGHMAVGVKGDDDISGSYYEYEGTKYFYFETTNSGWGVGEIPIEFENADTIITPIYGGYPELRIQFTGSSQSDRFYSYVDLEIKVENVGSADAEDIVIYTTLETTDEGMVWDQLKSDVIPDLEVENSVMYTVSNLKVPSGEQYRVGIRARGSNTDTKYVYSEWAVA